MNIALFDFDGTITNADMYSKFLHYSATKRRKLLAKAVLIPFFILYKLGVLPAPSMRVIASFVAFAGRKTNEVFTAGERYADEQIPSFLRDEAVKRLNWHKSNGDLIVVVSASLDVYLKHWCAERGFSLICSELKTTRGKFTGEYINGDCSFINKTRRILDNFELTNYEKIYAYGDTKEDIAMLNLADEAYLNWQPYVKSETYL